MNKPKRLKVSKPTKTDIKLYGPILLIGLCLLLAIILFGRELGNINNKIDTLIYNQKLTKNEIEYQKTISRPSLIASNDNLAFPELRIMIPYNNITKTFFYAVDELQNTSVSSTSVVEQTVNTQLGCQGLVILSTKSSTPYSPWDQFASEVHLADGRTLYIIKAIAFENNEASTMHCPATAWQQITPEMVVDEFKKAQSY